MWNRVLMEGLVTHAILFHVIEQLLYCRTGFCPMESMRSWNGLCLRTKSTRIVKEILRRSWLALMIQCLVVLVVVAMVMW